MIYGRTSELDKLNQIYESDNNSLTVLYGRTGIGKTALIKEFIKDKPCFYYSAVPGALKQLRDNFAIQIKSQLHICDEEFENISSNEEASVIEKSLKATKNIESKTKLIIIEEFQNIVKQDKEFFNIVGELKSGKLYDEKVMIICTSSSISWIENSLVSSVGNAALLINDFLKLKELQFLDVVRMFSGYSVPECMQVYAVTGGVPKYLIEFSDKLSLKDNIIKAVLRENAPLRTEGTDFIKEELRETALYNTILSHISNGAYKLNELHALTGFGRDKISVYLKNLIEREIVDKIFSYDTQGDEYTRKGLYCIKSGYTEFWYKFIYARQSVLELMEPEEFYDKYIAGFIDEFAKETFVKVGTEFIELMDSMDRLPVKIDRKGRWWGKNGDIDIIACDRSKTYVIGKCNWLTKVFTFEMFEELMLNVNLAGIGKEYIYLFSRESFDEELITFAKENENINLISLNDL